MSNIVLLLVVVIIAWMAAGAVVGLIVAFGSVAVQLYPLIVLYAVVLHYVWAVCLVIDPSAGDATSMAGLFQAFGSTRLAILLVAVATLAIVYVFFTSIHRIGGVLLAIPQQIVLLVSAWTAIEAMRRGHFADGVERPVAFIVADQAPAVIAAVLHAAAIVIGFWQSKRSSFATAE